MPDEPTLSAIRMATVAASAGGAARVAMAVYGGRHGRWLMVEAFVGAMLGVTAAGVAGWFDPQLLEEGRRLFVIGGIGGAAGALGTRALDLLMAALQKRLGMPQ